VGFVVDKVAVEEDFLKHFGFFLPIITPPILLPDLLSRGGTTDPF
jgi:hypothetical protein